MLIREIEKQLKLRESIKNAEIYLSKNNVKVFLNKYLGFLLDERRKGLKLSVKAHGGSFTDGKTMQVALPFIFLEKPDNQKFIALKALLGHEAQHVNSSNFKEYTKHVDSEIDYLMSKYDIPKGLAGKIVTHIANSLEDGRIEKILVNRLYGYKKHIKFLNLSFWKEQPVRGQEFTDFLYAITSIAVVGLPSKGFPQMYESSEALNNLIKIRPLITQAINARTCKDGLDVSKKILREIEDYIVTLIEKAKEEAKNQKKNNEKGEGDSSGEPGESGEGGDSQESRELTQEEVEELLDDIAKGLKDADDYEWTNSDEVDFNEDPTESNHLTEEKTEEESDYEESKDGSTSSSEEESDDSDDKSSKKDNKSEDDDSSKDENSEKENTKECDDSSGNNKNGDSDDSEETTDSKDTKSDDSNQKDDKPPTELPDDWKPTGDEDFSGQIADDLEEIVKDLDEEWDREVEREKRKEERKDSRSKKKKGENEPIKIDPLELSKDYKDDIYTTFEEVLNSQPIESLPPELQREARIFKKDVNDILKKNETMVQRGLKRGLLDANKLTNLSLHNYNVFIKRDVKVTPDYAGYILQDGSGSMNGEKEKESARACAMLEEGLKEHMPLKITTFSVHNNVTHYKIKGFEEKSNKNFSYNAYVRRDARGGNKDGYSIRVATKELLERNERDKILFILSDGIPTDYRGGQEMGMKDVHEAVKEARQKGIYVVAVMFGNSSFIERTKEKYEYMYEKNIIATEPENISKNIKDVMKRILKH